MAGKLSQPGCHTNTGMGGRSGRSLVMLPTFLPGNRRRGDGRFSSIPAMRGQVRKVEKKKKNGKKMLGRTCSILQFSAKPAKANFKNEKEGVEMALRTFKRLWSTKVPSPLLPLQVLAVMKVRYPHLFVNRGHIGEGHVPGVDVGDAFAFRAELCLVGLHRKPIAGIDWKDIERDGRKFSIALSIVVSGGYEDDLDEGEILSYTGEGGQDGQKKQCEDQKMDGGNMALRNSKFVQNSVRVIRGRPDKNSPSSMLYSYDGLYRVVDWKETVGISEFKVFKYILVREDGQKPLQWDFPVSSPRQKVSRGFESPPRRDLGGQVSLRYWQRDVS